MPNLDGTGPAGSGSKTGGQMGNCPGADRQDYPRDGRGQGQGCRRKHLAHGRGLGRGLGRKTAPDA